jgi:tRNA A-37 threonylcarbamoyl transferase component Bud32
MRARILFAASPEWCRLSARLEGLVDSRQFECIKANGRTRAGFLRCGEHQAFVKRVDSAGYARGLMTRLFGSRGHRALRGARILAAAGFAHPRPVLIVQTLNAGSIRASYVVAEPLRTALVLSRFALGRARPPILRRRVSQLVGAEIRRLHAAGIYTRDLQETNLMIEERDAQLMLYFVDFEDFRQVRAVSFEQRMRNLVHLDRSVGRFASRAQRLRFFYDYLGRRPAREEARRLVRQYAAVRARVERRHRRHPSAAVGREVFARSGTQTGLGEASASKE